MTYENPYMNGQIWPELNILEWFARYWRITGDE